MSRITARLQIALEIARKTALLATCPRKSVGCVLLDDTYSIFSQGFNGASRRLKHCSEVGCLLVDVGGRMSCQRAVHAEANAIYAAARAGRSVRGSIAVTTVRPCEKCAIAMYQAGVVACWYDELYEGPEGIVDELRQAGWSCAKLP